MTMHKYAMETLGAGNVAAAVRRFFFSLYRVFESSDKHTLSKILHRSNYHPEKI